MNSIPTIVYCATHKDTNRHYVGITSTSLKTRWKNHVSDAKSDRTRQRCHFHSALAKYGVEAFDVSTLYVYPSREEALEAEEYLVDILDLRNTGFNMLPGGDITPPQLGRKRSPETIEKMRRASTGVIKSEETKRKVSEALKGRPRPPEVRAAISAYQSNRTPEHQAKLAAAITGRKLSPETIAKRQASRAANKKPLTDEQRARISEGQRRRRQRMRDIALTDALATYS